MSTYKVTPTLGTPSYVRTKSVPLVDTAISPKSDVLLSAYTENATFVPSYLNPSSLNS